MRIPMAADKTRRKMIDRIIFRASRLISCENLVLALMSLISLAAIATGILVVMLAIVLYNLGMS